MHCGSWILGLDYGVDDWIMGLMGVVYEVGETNRVTPTKSLPLIKCTTKI